MSDLALDARALEDLMQEVVLRVRDIRGLVLVDDDGLAMLSTLGSRDFEDSLAAFTGIAERLLERARVDFQMGPLHLLRLAGRDRQVVMVPIGRGLNLLAVAETSATPSVLEAHLLALSRSMIDSLFETALGKSPETS